MRIDLRDISWRRLRWLDGRGFVKSIPEDAYDRIKPDTSFDFWGLTIGDLVKVTKNEVPKVLARWIGDDINAYDYVARSKGWKQWLESFGEVMAKVGDAGTPTKCEEYVRKALPKMTAEESLLTFTRAYFGLQGFDGALSVTLGDYYLARKDDFARRLSERRAREWQEKETKRNERRRKRWK